MNRTILPKTRNAFTLTELLVVLAVIAILTMTLLPALAGTKRNSKLAQCLMNLRQIYVGCSMYANDFNNWYPIWYLPDGGHPVNVLTGVHYTYYFFDGNPNTPIPQQYTQPTGSLENFGYLYAGHVINDGHIFFCPSYSGLSPSSANYLRGPDDYSKPQFLSTDPGGLTRSTYFFNPRVQNPSSNLTRKYQKVTDVKNMDTFTVEYFENTSSGSGLKFTPDNWAHWPFKGFSTLYTDGSAKLAMLNATQFNNVANLLLPYGETTSVALQYDAVFTYLQTSP